MYAVSSSMKIIDALLYSKLRALLVVYSNFGTTHHEIDAPLHTREINLGLSRRDLHRRIKPRFCCLAQGTIGLLLFGATNIFTDWQLDNPVTCTVNVGICDQRGEGEIRSFSRN